MVRLPSFPHVSPPKKKKAPTKNKPPPSHAPHAITAPRWVLSRTWGDARTDLRLENRFPRALIDALRAAGHEVNTVDAFDEVMGHAGAIVLHDSGLMEGATDPRSCGAVAAF